MGKYRLWRCQICGDPYLGEEKPADCPFCGAHEKYIVEGKDYAGKNTFPLTDVSRENLKKALALEISNASFYSSASMTSESEEMRAAFKALSKIEAEHASTIKKLLQGDVPVITPEKGADSSFEKDADNLNESHRREQNAIEHYSKFLSEATEPRLKEVFASIIEIEKDHLGFSGERI